MKIAIAKSILENILVHAQPFLEKKDTSQITSHLLFEINSNTLIVKATDYQRYKIRTALTTKVSEKITIGTNLNIVNSKRNLIR